MPAGRACDGGAAAGIGTDAAGGAVGGAAAFRASVGSALDAEVSTESAAGALLVARSTVILRTASGVLAGRLKVAAAGGAGAEGGPDNNSGTINTSSTSKIDAPTRRSLTRLSMKP
ncbi:MAG TPA: hypothetical protein VNW26_10980 [Steroidobacteraceae bacterium]|nr:hypothetical protein [Steroidobacteraceae bacterium]